MSWPAVLGQWSFDPSIVIGVILAAALYWRGQHGAVHVVASRRVAARRWNALAFYAGLGFVVLALESPIDVLSADLFTFHMVQHLLLIMVAAPLLVLGDPSVTLLRGIPLSLRRRTLGRLAGNRGIRWLGHRLSWLIYPRTVFMIFLADLYLWHWSWLFNLTLQNNIVHLLEHICFLGTALLFWSQVIDQRALHPRLSYAQRALYVVIVAACSNVLAMYFVFTPKPLYTAYAHPLHRLYGMTPLGDQQIAGAVMWVPVLFLFGGAFAVCLYKALAQSEREDIPVPVGGTPYSMLFMTGENGVIDSAH
ncbi:MAG TPA: cytochrome c oxidase assembly protein [Chloroflexota bacterium]